MRLRINRASNAIHITQRKSTQMKKQLLLATVAISMVPFAGTANAQFYGAPRYGPRPYLQPYVRYAPAPVYVNPPVYAGPRGPNPLDFFGAFLSAIPMIAGAAQPQPYPQCQAAAPMQTQYDPCDPNIYLEEKRVTKQEVEAAMQIFCSEHGSMMICLKIERLMREQQGRP
jgi:hypothetical protein